MRWNLVSTFGLSCKEAEKGVACLSLVHILRCFSLVPRLFVGPGTRLTMLVLLIFFIMEIDLSKKKKRKPCALLDFTTLDQKLVIKFVWPY